MPVSTENIPIFSLSWKEYHQPKAKLIFMDVKFIDMKFMEVKSMESAYLAAVHTLFNLSLNKYYLPLLAHFGSFAEVWHANKFPPALGIPETLGESFREGRRNLEPERLFDHMQKKNIRVVTRRDKEFSPNLLQIMNIPCILYYCGELLHLQEKSIAVIGSRMATQYGLKMASRMAGELAEAGLTIVSGMARGIDGAAHEGALARHGKTVAVLGSGLDRPYPRENQRLFAEICERGLAVSEFPLHTPPLPSNFPVRNRIISGLSLGVFVIEAQVQSGSFITVDYALEQGREVFALPGPVDSPNSMGPLRLVQTGAKLVITADDVLEELGFEYRQGLFKRQKEQVQLLTVMEKRVLQHLSWEPAHIERLLEICPDIQDIYEALLVLEMKGLIKQLPGKYYVRI